MINWTVELTGMLRLLLSLLCGALIGLDRERGHRPAGLRTHTLVCMGSCLVMYISIWAAEKHAFGGDPLRMGAQVISGIGFLGAGTIIKAGHDVRGLTTAACLWTVACIGLALGAGYYIGGLFATALVLLTLSIFKGVENRIEPETAELVLQLLPGPGHVEEILSCLAQWGITVQNVHAKRKGEGVQLTLRLQRPRGLSLAVLVARLIEREEVTGVREQRAALL